ncbi:hypothetical protein GQ42DRAFT_161594 [Ramicandelaber brevisporus]|nr:hypothetical protein GQ42DRAFT_161594 [Ramicandelaber brevisporus]
MSTELLAPVNTLAAEVSQLDQQLTLLLKAIASDASVPSRHNGDNDDGMDIDEDDDGSISHSASSRHLEDGPERSVERAKQSVTLAYAIATSIWMYLRTQGINTKDHPIMLTLDKTKKYFARIKDAEQKLKNEQAKQQQQQSQKLQEEASNNASNMSSTEQAKNGAESNSNRKRANDATEEPSLAVATSGGETKADGKKKKKSKSSKK